MSDENNSFILRMLERLDQKLDDLMRRTVDQGSALTGHIASEDSTFDGVRDDIKALNDALKEQSVHLATYNEHLKEHMRRTELLEQRVDPLERDYLERALKGQFTAAHWKKLGIVAGAVSGLIGFVWTLMQIFRTM